MHDAVRHFDDRAWRAGETGASTHAVESVLEAGRVLHFANLGFALQPGEERLLAPRFADGKAKNISLRGESGALRGAAGSVPDRVALQAMLARFREQASALVQRLFPHYDGALARANTTYRPLPIEGRAGSWRKDDTRLHIDAFPSNPTQGNRLLRVFTNINPHGQVRAWRVGEPFEAFAQTFLPRIAKPLPGSAWWLHRLRITKARRTLYDHCMLQLHDAAKADLAYQVRAPQQQIDFRPGATWLVYSDQVLHAAMAGQYMMEQTFTLAPEALLAPQTAPVNVLQRLLGRELLAGRDSAGMRRG